MDEKDIKTSGVVDVSATNQDDTSLAAPSDVAATIYIDPQKEAAALKKFDRWFVPVAFCFLLLSYLDRNNVSGLYISLYAKR